ncbi:hypothetical protein L1049_006076 [Liquidambar formosana]|uniref:F-box domain-containing protein n=1 Tax=Liquidambar formosana TaxID=63359 RepID=A0AAP0RGG4_LIQFO
MENSKRQNTETSIPPDFVFDLLARLPVKSVIRFRSVCKLWASITHDPCFVNLRRTRSITQSYNPNLLISFYNPDKSNQYLLRANHSGGPATHLLTLFNTKPCRLTESVDGIVTSFMYYDSISYLDKRAYSFNPTTRQIATLPADAQTTISDPFRLYNVYAFGFDPSTEKYKVLNIRVNCLTGIAKECKILTLGGTSSSWRKIDAVPPCIDCRWLHYCQRCVCVNGVSHWLHRAWRIVVAFDFRYEEFALIHLPKDVSLFCPDDDEPAMLPLWPDLIQVDGHLAVVIYEPCKSVEILVLEDYRKQVWTKERILISLSFCEQQLVPVGSIHTGEILLAPCEFGLGPVEMFYYDVKGRGLRSVKIAGIPEWMISDGSAKATFVINHTENILSLRAIH